MEYLTVELQALIVFVSEIVFLYLKTINVKAISEGSVGKAIVSNTGVSICWVVGVTISINSILNGHFLPIVAFLVGGAIGTALAMKKKRSKRLQNLFSFKKVSFYSIRIF